MNKKITYGLGAIMASAIPIASVISCGSDDDWSIGGLNKQISSKLADAVKNGTDMNSPDPVKYPDVTTPAAWKVDIKIVTDGLWYVNKNTNFLKWLPYFEGWEKFNFYDANTKTLILYNDVTNAIDPNSGNATYVAEEFNEAGIKEMFTAGKVDGSKSGIDYTKLKDFLSSNYSKLKL